MTVNDALKMLYEKMGGTADVSGVTTSSEMIDYIEDVAGSGGGGGSVEDFSITATWDVEAERYYLDKTWKEIKDAFVAGNRCIVTSVEVYSGETYSETITKVGLVVGYSSEIRTGEYPSATYRLCITRDDNCASAQAAGENEYPEMS